MGGSFLQYLHIFKKLLICMFIKHYLLIHDKFYRIKGEFALKVCFNEDET